MVVTPQIPIIKALIHEKWFPNSELSTLNIFLFFYTTLSTFI